jgi:hypothetical protein
LLFISQPSCSPLAKSWPRSWCKTGGFLSLGSPDGRTRHADSTQPCGHACSREWCRRPQLELRAISQGCERVARHTGQVQDSGDTQAWFQSEQCWATKICKIIKNMARISSPKNDIRACTCIYVHIDTKYWQIHAIHTYTYLSYLAKNKVLSDLYCKIDTNTPVYIHILAYTFI